MKYDMKKPCPNCPFRSDRVFPLHPERARSILDGIMSGLTFSCHKTIDYDALEENGEEDVCDVHHTPSEGEQHCAGALILLEKMKRPNQMMRIAERLGMYDHTKLDMNSPVFDDDNEMCDAIEAKYNE